MARYINTENGRIYVSNFVCEQMEKIPTADVVEVVRCKDCERGNKYKDHYFCCMDNSKMNADDFCSYGERAER